MSKNKPQTIADLQINWTFDWNLDYAILAKIQEANPKISHLKIVKNNYRFLLINKWDFTIEINDHETLANLLWEIDGKVFPLQDTGKLPKVLVLNHFELIEKNTFRIHVKE